MNKVSTLLNKPVLSLFEGEILGESCEVFFTSNIKQVALIKFDSKQTDTPNCFAPNALYNIGSNAITIRNKSYLQNVPDDSHLIPFPVNLKVYSIEGEYKGKIVDIVFSPKHKVLELILDNEKNILQSEIISCSKTSLVVGNQKSKIKTFKIFPQLTSQKNHDPKVTQNPKPQIKTPVVPQPTLKSFISQSQLGNSVLLNKTCLKDIHGFSNELIARRGAKISSNIISMATKHGKLKELLLNCE